uniref:Uncharacterized protein n=1 Tax=Cacaos virus TaxID=2689365 RepID=A0A6B9KG58_9VIRU|nr:hypothetical protein 2 [Cacaos virus]
MSNPNVQSMSNPIVPVVAMPNLPPPQVISGTIAEQGMPVSIPPQLFGVQNLLNTNLLQITHVIRRIVYSAETNPGAIVTSFQLPIIAIDKDVGGNIAPSKIVNWAALQLCSFAYYEPVETIIFSITAPEAVYGKFLITWDPTDLVSEMYDTGVPIPPGVRTDRRMITKEWDLAVTKTFSITCSPHTISNTMVVSPQAVPRTGQGAYINGFVTVGASPVASMFNFGRLTLSTLQRLQIGNIYPSEYTIYVYGSFNGTTQRVPVDPRVNNFSNGTRMLTQASRNWANAFML